MKKTIFTMGALVLSFLTASVMAQVPETQPAQPAPTQNWDYKKNPTVAAITAKYESKYITTKTELTDVDYYPVIGKYESSNVEAANVVIVLDAENRGMLWIDGLPQGRIKAFLRKSPATYKIPAQKTEDGKDVAEGTLIYDKDANTLNILIGKDYNLGDPVSVFAVEEPVEEAATTKTKTKSKTKKVSKPKTWSYTGSKLIEVKETTNVDVQVKPETNQ